jgi:hypothetical protein
VGHRGLQQRRSRRVSEHSHHSGDPSGAVTPNGLTALREHYSRALLGASYSRLLRGSPPVPLPIASNTLLCAHNGRRRLDGWLVGSGGCRSNSAAAGTSPLDAGGCGGYSGAARSSLLEPAAAGATSGPAALPYAPAATAMATRPSSPPPRLVDNPHAPPCPPMPPLPRARQLEPAPWRLVGGMAGDVCRPHQEDRPAQGQLTARALAFAITGGAVHPPAAPRYVLCGLARTKT